MSNVKRVPLQRRELEVALSASPDSVIRRAAEAMAVVMDGGTVVIEERIGMLPGDEELIEETIIEAGVRSPW